MTTLLPTNLFNLIVMSLLENNYLCANIENDSALVIWLFCSSCHNKLNKKHCKKCVVKSEV